MFYLNLEMADLLTLNETLTVKLEEQGRKAAQKLAEAIHNHIQDEVKQKLRSSREDYEEALSFKAEGSLDSWIIELDRTAMWIEQGIPAGHNMIPDLLNDSPRPGSKKQASGKTKTSKDGNRYRVIPFLHNEKPTSQTPKQNSLTDMVRASLKKQKIPYEKLETQANGKPISGLVRSFDINKSPLSKSGIPLLQGVNVYQNTQGAAGRKSESAPGEGGGAGAVKKSILTFRTVSDSQEGKGKWIHPGLSPRNFFEEAMEWAQKEWDSEIVPELMRNLDDL